MMGTMKAAVLTELGAPLEIVDLRAPSELDIGQVYVRMEWAGARRDLAVPVEEMQGLVAELASP